VALKGQAANAPGGLPCTSGEQADQDFRLPPRMSLQNASARSGFMRGDALRVYVAVDLTVQQL
jgi:hypothetical protein